MERRYIYFDLENNDLVPPEVHQFPLYQERQQSCKVIFNHLSLDPAVFSLEHSCYPYTEI